MDLFKLIKQFWQLRRSKRITNLQADVYYFLLHECNSRNWENPFMCSNGLICTSIGITEKSLIDARNVLQQLGLIEFEGGVTKQKSPKYYLLDYCNKVSSAVGNRGGKRGSNRGGNGVYINKDQTETTQRRSSDSIESDAPSDLSKPQKEEKEKKLAPKKEKDVTPHWEEMKALWIGFYQERFDHEPKFEALEATNLFKILKRLRKLSEAKGYEWNLVYATKVFTHFLTKAYSEKWMKENFLIPTLYSKFDAIINRKDGEGVDGKQAGIAAFKAKLAAGA